MRFNFIRKFLADVPKIWKIKRNRKIKDLQAMPPQLKQRLNHLYYGFPNALSNSSVWRMSLDEQDMYQAVAKACPFQKM